MSTKTGGIVQQEGFILYTATLCLISSTTYGPLYASKNDPEHSQEETLDIVGVS